MIALTAAEVAAATGGRLHPDDVDPRTVVHGPVVVDSRQVETGSLFVALPGEHVDGHDFAAAAVAAGAALVLAAHPVAGADGSDLPTVLVDDVERALGDLARAVLLRLRTDDETGATPLSVVGVTGSVGKTTTKDLLAQLLTPTGPTIAPVASFNNEIGLPLTVLRADEQTRFLVLEMGASGLGHLTYLTDIAPPDVAVVLVVGSAHLGEFGGHRGGRARQVRDRRGPGARRDRGAQRGRHARVRDGLRRPGRRAHVRHLRGRRGAGDRHHGSTGPAGPVHADRRRAGGTGRRAGQLRLVGEHHVHNALAAACGRAAPGAVRSTRSPSACPAPGPLSPHRMNVVERAGRRHRDRRLVQRQPGLDARRAQDARDRRRPRPPVGRRPRRDARARRRTTARRTSRSASWSSGSTSG